MNRSRVLFALQAAAMIAAGCLGGMQSPGEASKAAPAWAPGFVWRYGVAPDAAEWNYWLEVLDTDVTLDGAPAYLVLQFDRTAGERRLLVVDQEQLILRGELPEDLPGCTQVCFLSVQDLLPITEAPARAVSGLEFPLQPKSQVIRNVTISGTPYSIKRMVSQGESGRMVVVSQVEKASLLVWAWTAIYDESSQAITETSVAMSDGHELGLPPEGRFASPLIASRAWHLLDASLVEGPRHTTDMVTARLHPNCQSPEEGGSEIGACGQPCINVGSPLRLRSTPGIIYNGVARAIAAPLDVSFEFRFEADAPSDGVVQWILTDENGTLLKSGNQASFEYHFERPGVYFVRGSGLDCSGVRYALTSPLELAGGLIAVGECDSQSTPVDPGQCEPLDYYVPKGTRYMAVAAQAAWEFGDGEGKFTVWGPDGSVVGTDSEPVNQEWNLVQQPFAGQPGSWKAAWAPGVATGVSLLYVVNIEVSAKDVEPPTFPF